MRIQKRVLKDYLSNLFHKSVAENTEVQCSFATFARIRPSHFILANFSNKTTCLSTHHQNYALKLKMLKKYVVIPTRPETFVKYSDEHINSTIKGIDVADFTFDMWKKVTVLVKGRETKKMKIVTETLTHSEFCKRMIDDTHSFRSHVHRISCQFKQQRYLKENLLENQVYIHMDFAEDYRCRLQNKIQSAYWFPTQVTIHPVVMYYNQNGKVMHKSYVFISNESSHDYLHPYSEVDPTFKSYGSSVRNGPLLDNQSV